jgi:pyruvate dehydrogenase E1 component alpha subunit
VGLAALDPPYYLKQGEDVTEAMNSPAGAAGCRTDYEKSFLLGLYERMSRIRQFEDGIKFLFLEGIMPGTIHQCQGQEATAVGVCSALRADDWITSTFRGHGHALAKGLSVQELLDELFGAESGCCRGRGGSMHVGNVEKGMIPGIAIVGGGIPVAAGLALAFKMQKTDRLAVCFFGDGAVAEGAFHEGINMAAIWELPVVFACENNLYGASTHVSKVMRDTNIARRVKSYGIRSEQLDGNDVLAVYEAARSAVDDCRAGKGPVFLELLTYRCTGHSRRDACHYQPKDERDEWTAKDPIRRFAEVLKGRGLVDDAELNSIDAAILGEFQQAVERARQAPLPLARDLADGVYV